MANKKENFLTYRGKPLVRNGDSLYYGDPADKFVVMLKILSYTGENDSKMANYISVQLIATDITLKMQERLIKKAEKQGLYPALNIASIWLERALDDEKKKKI